MKLPRFITRRYWYIRVSWKYLTGRWFVFRDVPDWVCVEYLSGEDHADARMRELASLAGDELHSRLAIIRRKLEKAEAS